MNWTFLKLNQNSTKIQSECFIQVLPTPALKPTLTKLINQAADDFREVAADKQPAEKKFQVKISIGLSRFTPLRLDTEDRERGCSYFKELMDIVGLESSGGYLNEWIYGFDPTN